MDLPFGGHHAPPATSTVVALKVTCVLPLTWWHFVAQAPEPGEQPASPPQSVPGQGAGPTQGSCVGPTVGGQQLLPVGIADRPSLYLPARKGGHSLPRRRANPEARGSQSGDLTTSVTCAAGTSRKPACSGLGVHCSARQPWAGMATILVCRRGSEAGHVATLQRPPDLTPAGRTREPTSSGPQPAAELEPGGPAPPAAGRGLRGPAGPGQAQGPGRNPL